MQTSRIIELAKKHFTLSLSASENVEYWNHVTNEIRKELSVLDDSPSPFAQPVFWVLVDRNNYMKHCIAEILYKTCSDICMFNEEYIQLLKTMPSILHDLPVSGHDNNEYAMIKCITIVDVRTCNADKLRRSIIDNCTFGRFLYFEDVLHLDTLSL